jgi:hypothetical protein
MVNAQGIRAGAAYIELYTKDSRLVKGLAAASARLKAFGASVQSLGFKTMAAGTAMLTPFLSAARHFATAGDQLNKMSQRTGVSVEVLSELGYAAEQSGTDIETLETTLRKMQKQLVEAAQGSKSAQQALSALGLSVSDLSRLSPDAQFRLIADRLARIDNPARRAALAMEVFGKSGTQLLPLMSDGARGIRLLESQARELGLTMSQQDAEAATRLGDAFTALWKTVLSGARVVGGALAPLLTDLATSAARIVITLRKWIEQNKALVVTVFKVIAGVIAAGAGLIALGTIFVGLGTVLGGIVTVFGAIGTAVAIVGKVLAALLSPIGLVVAAVASLAAYVVYASGLGGAAIDALAQNFAALKDDAIGAWRGIADALAAGDIALAAKILWLSLKMEWRRGINFLNGLWIQFKDFFLSTVTGAVYGAARILNDGWAAIEVGWTETIGFLSDAWAVFTNLLTKTWHTAVGFIQKAWVRLKSLFDEDINVDAEVTRINREVEQSNAGADQGMLEAVGKRDQERRARRSQIEADRTGIEQTLGEMQSTEDARRQSQFAQDLADTEGELARAREEWQAAIGKAADERAATGMTDPTRLKKLQDSLADSGSLLGDEQRKIDTQGTFSALAARGLGADSLAERTARASEQIVANTKQLVDQAKQGKLVFTS